MDEGKTYTLINAVFGAAAIDSNDHTQQGEQIRLMSGDFTNCAIPELLPIPTIIPVFAETSIHINNSTTLTITSNSTGELSVNNTDQCCTVTQIDTTHWTITAVAGAAAGTASTFTISQTATQNYRAYTITCTLVVIGDSYNITTNVTNGSYSGATTIETIGITEVYITPDSGYSYPDTITVTGASYIWNNDSGIVALTSPTGAVIITVICE